MSARSAGERSARFDVAVVGGGVAGLGAALAAARCGAHTVLIERGTRLGGNAVHGMVHTICGLFLLGDGGPPELANPGLPARFAEALRRAGAAREPERVGRVWVLPTDPPRLASVARGLCEQTPGVALRLGAELIGAHFEADAGVLRLAHDRGGVETVAARIVVDASGDACAAARGGADVERAHGDALQIPSYIFRLAGVDAGAVEELQGFARLRLSHALAGAVRDGSLPKGCEAVLVRPGSESGQVYVTLNVPRPSDGDYDPLDPTCLAALEAGARRGAEQVVAFLRRTRAPFEKCRVDAWPERLGVRETRRACGRDTITRSWVLDGRRSQDEVARSAWPIELWQDHRRPRIEYPTGPCSVPLGALVSRTHPRLALAGRCLSGDREALGSLRVLGTAMATGEAAGTAAALAADSGESLPALAPARIRQHILAAAG